jgi:hypothetical protein
MYNILYITTHREPGISHGLKVLALAGKKFHFVGKRISKNWLAINLRTF